MAIYRVSGQMLQSTLVRDGNSIAFANTANSTATLFVDIANTRVGVNSNVANVTLDVNGNIFALNLSSTGNITAANINATIVSASGNVTGGNILTIGVISATGNLTSGNVLSTGLISTTGNATHGNILTGGVLSATGNVTAGNVSTAGNVVAGNVLVGNILIPTVGNITVGNVNINNLSNPVANSDAATKYYVDQTAGASFGNLSVSNTTITTTLANGNITLTATGTELVQVTGNGGVVIPVGNTFQRPNPPPTGTLRYNTSTNLVEIYNGSGWQSAGGATSAITNQTISPDGTSATYTLDQATTAVSILLTINGVNQTPGVDYTVAGDQLTLTTVPLVTDIIQVRFISTTTTVTEITNSSGNTSVMATDTSTINFEINTATAAQITSAKIFDISMGHSLKLPSYTVAQAANLANVATGEVIYVSNGDTGNPCLAVYSGGAFKRISFGANIST